MTERPRILLVDDDATNLQVIGSALRESNRYSISIAMNGEEGLRQASAAPPDLILLDVMMPGISGYEVCQHLKEDAALNAIPIIFLTAKAESKDIVEGLRMGGADYISKPFVPEVLLARIETHLSLYQKQKELDRFYRKQEAMRQHERNAAYQNGMTEMRISVLHCIGNALSAVEAHYPLLKQIGPGLEQLGEAFEVASDLLARGDDLPRAERLVSKGGEMLKGSYQQQFNESCQAMEEGMNYIKGILEAQRNLCSNHLIASRFELGSLVDDVQQVMSGAFQRDQIQFQFHSDSSLKEIEMPRSPFGQVLIHNSLSAIRNYCSEGEGRIDLKVEMAPETAQWSLLLIDNGEGIAPERIDRLIAPSVTQNEEGVTVGMGLHHAANFIQSVGGTLEVKSDGVGQGASIQLQFPLAIAT